MILLLGCDGYIGNALTQRLLFRGHSVVGVDNFIRCEWVEKEMRSFSATPVLTMKRKEKLFKYMGDFEFHYIDIAREPGRIEDIIKAHVPDTIINLAHLPSGPYSQISRKHATLNLENNIIGTNNLLWAIRECCPDVHYITIGTTGEYDHYSNIDIEEGYTKIQLNGRESNEVIYPRRPASIYHTSKVASTYLIDFLSRTWDLRCTDVMQAVVFGCYTEEIDETGLYSRLDSDECLIGDTNVLTPNGYRNIIDLNIGNEVYTHNGNIKKITKTFKRHYKGDGYKIDIQYGISFTTTKNHPYYVAVSPYEHVDNTTKRTFENIDWYSAEEIYNLCNTKKYKSNNETNYDYNEVVLLRKKEFTYKQIAEKTGVKYNTIVSWLSKKNTPRQIKKENATLKKDLFFVIPKLKYTTCNIKLNVKEIINYGVLIDGMLYCCNSTNQNKPANRNKGIPNTINIDDDFCRLLGYFLAEGSLTDYTTCFSFNANEDIYHDDVSNIIRNIFGLEVRRSVHGKGMNIICDSKLLAKFFKNLFGKGCRHKKIPDSFMCLPDHCVKNILKGYWRGDGTTNVYKNSRKVVITSVSKELLEQCQYLLLKFGMVSNIIKRKRQQKMSFEGRDDYVLNTVCYDLSLCGDMARKFMMEICEEVIGDELNNYCNLYYTNDNYIFIPIVSIEKVLMNENVYNFEVEDDESYLIPISTHNCGGTVLNRFMVQAVLDIPLTVYGAGHHQRGFLSLNDSIQALEIAVNNSAEKGKVQVWNQLSEWHSMNDIARMVQSVLKEKGVNVKISHIDTPRTEYTGEHYYKYKTDKLKKLGYKPTRSIEKEIEYVYNLLINFKEDLYPLKDVVLPKITWWGSR